MDILYEPDDSTQAVLVHVHGIGGNFNENKFCDFLARGLTGVGIAFCAFNNRRAEFIKEIHQVLA
jgi:predicted alpha/beta-fold hydrolase